VFQSRTAVLADLAAFTISLIFAPRTVCYGFLDTATPTGRAAVIAGQTLSRKPERRNERLAVATVSAAS
jgi:hypothetical protein